MTERSSDSIAAFLGILKAGAAYVPLDPSYPVERLSFMMADTRASLLITQPNLAERAPMRGGEALVLNGGPLPAPPAPASAPVTRNELAYVMYTSGSTGRPKGVMVPHRGIVRLVKGNGYARLDGTRAILQLAPTSFDAATFEIWGALLHGGERQPLPEKIRQPGAQPADLA